MSTDPNCLFCKIIAGEIPGSVVHKDGQLTAIRDINPAAPVHILLMPNSHLSGVAEAGQSDAGLLGALLLAGAQLARQEGIAEEGYRLVINNGDNGGQSVAHLHLHLLGGRRLSWPPG